MAVISTFAIALTTLLYSAPDSAQEAKVKEIFDEYCTSCHSGGGNPASDPAMADFDVPPNSLVGVPSAATGQQMVVPGKPEASYLMLKLKGGKGMDGDTMPLSEDPFPPDKLKLIEDWISGLPAAGGGGAGGGGAGGGGAGGGSSAPAEPVHKADPAKAARVKEIFDDKCTSCHSGGGNPASDPSGGS